jgi:AraC family transcriptional regulator of adaptative response/methylated-DNA-[protein]-cysteine methyltransferase
METLLDIFEATTGTLDKAVLKNKLNNTQLSSEHLQFIINKWTSGDEQLTISYQIHTSPVGMVLLASTEKGIVYLGFEKSSRISALNDLKRRFPENTIINQDSELIQNAKIKLNNPESNIQIQLHLKGTSYQLSIWEKLLLIPFGGLVNYKRLGNGEPDAREIGATVGANPVSVLVPCHRVIKADGTFNGYFWGNKKKAELLTYEATVNEDTTRN